MSPNGTWPLAVLIDQSLAQQSSEKLPLAANRSKFHRGPQPHIMERERPWMECLNGRSLSNPSPPGSGALLRKRKVACKSQRGRRTASEQGPLNNRSKAPRSSQRLKGHAQAGRVSTGLSACIITSRLGLLGDS